MSRYRKVLARIWEDDKFPYLSETGRLLFLYHLTSPRSTPFLLYVEGSGAIADALRLPSARLREGMREVAGKGLVWYSDDESNLLCLPNALTIKENDPESPNAVKTWAKLFHDLPRKPFRDRCLQHWLGLGLDIRRALTHAFLKACALARPIQEQEQEQYRRRDTVSFSRTTPSLNGPAANNQVRSGSASGTEQAREVLAFLNEKRAEIGMGQFRPVEVHLTLIASRLADGATIQDCRSIIARKVRDWKDEPKSQAWIRPSTIFRRANFENYLAELTPKASP